MAQWLPLATGMQDFSAIAEAGAGSRRMDDCGIRQLRMRRLRGCTKELGVPNVEWTR